MCKGNVWREKSVSFCKHYGHGNDAVLTYLSRYVFRTAISNARILGMDQTHVTFRWKDRGTTRGPIERLPGVAFLRRGRQHVLPLGFHKVRYYGLWHPSKRDQSNRAWLLLILATPADAAPTAEDIKPLGGVERADGTRRSSCRRGGGSRRGPAAMSPLRWLPDAVPWRFSWFRRAVTLTGAALKRGFERLRASSSEKRRRLL